MANVRWPGSRNMLRISDRVEGARVAPAIPRRARVAIRLPSPLLRADDNPRRPVPVIALPTRGFYGLWQGAEMNRGSADFLPGRMISGSRGRPPRWRPGPLASTRARGSPPHGSRARPLRSWSHTSSTVLGAVGTAGRDSDPDSPA